MIKLSDYVVRFVADLGVKHVFLVVGGGAMHLNHSLAKNKKIKFVCNLHEQASSICAENYSKATNHFGVCMVTSGPGGTNAVTGLVGAWLDSTPCLFISGQVKRPDRMFNAEGAHLGVRQIGVQEVDIVSIVKSVTKHAVTITDPLSIRYHLEKAIYLAQTGRPGPVWIDIPVDVQATPIDEAALKPFDPKELEQPKHTTNLAAQVREIIEKLNQAERPLFLIGNGIRLARAEKELHQVLKTLDIPVQTTWLALDLMPENHPQFAGRPGAVAPRGANFALQNSDFLLSVGARFDRVITAFAPENFARAAHKIMVDVDPAEIAKMGNVIQSSVCADAGDFLRELLHQKEHIKHRDRSLWKKRCHDWKIGYPVVQKEHRVPKGPVSIYHLAEVLSQETKRAEPLVIGSSGSGIEIFLLAYHVNPKQRIFHTTALGAMGFGISASIGVATAFGKQTICIDGDGGFQFNIQELETVRRLKLPIKFFVLNNDGYASIRSSQIGFFGESKIGCDHTSGQTLPDLGKVAKAYGLKAMTIANQRNLRESVRRVLQTPGPVVCDVHVIRDEIRAPRVSSVQRPDGSFVAKPLEDLWPFLDRKEFLANMIVPPLPE